MSFFKGKVCLEWAGAGLLVTELDVDFSTSFDVAKRGKAAEQCAFALQKLVQGYFQSEQRKQQGASTLYDDKLKLFIDNPKSMCIRLNHNGCELTHNFHDQKVRSAWLEFAQQLEASADSSAFSGVVLSLSSYSAIQLALWSLESCQHNKVYSGFEDAVHIEGFDAYVGEHPQVAIKATKRCGAVFKLLSPKLRQSFDVQLAAITAKCPALLGTVLKRTQTQHKKVVLVGLEKDPDAVTLIDSLLFADYDIALLSLQVCRTPLQAQYVFERMPHTYFNCKELLLAAVKKNPQAALQRARRGVLRDNLNIAKAAVSVDGLALQFVSASLAKLEDIALTAVLQNYDAFLHAPDFQNCKSFVLKAVAAHGKALKHVHADLQGDTDVVRTAVLQDGTALQYASHKYRACREIVEIAIRNNASALEFAADYLKQQPEVCLLACTISVPIALLYMHPCMKKVPRIKVLIERYQKEQATLRIHLARCNLNTFMYANGMGGPGYV